mgnify:CR=1 FL=1
MFETLSERLTGIFDKLTGRGSLSEADVDAAMREVRRALLEADVALEVVKTFTEKVKEKAVGAEIVKSIKPGQMVVKIVHDQLVETLGSDQSALNLRASPPVAILMVGLQGSGKTTSTAKIAKRLQDREKRKVLMASLDTRRPAAQEQLEILGKQVKVDTLPIIKGQTPVEIAKRAMGEARKGAYDIVMLDTAGRLHIDEELLAEAAAVRDIAKPKETLLVADALTGQDAVNLARAFDEKIGITGIVLTRIDGESGGRVSVFYDGEFYDNVLMEVRGNTTASCNKKSHRLEFSHEHPFRAPGHNRRLRKTSFMADYADPSYLRQHLSFWLAGMSLTLPSAAAPGDPAAGMVASAVVVVDVWPAGAATGAELSSDRIGGSLPLPATVNCAPTSMLAVWPTVTVVCSRVMRD